MLKNSLSPSLVSVIIPCYNHGQFIDDAVDSILAQTYTDYEIIIVNDGSTDEQTNEILKNYNKPKTKVYSIVNRGLPEARNYGISKAKGQYILTLDADDLFRETFIQKAVEILDTNENIGIVSSYLEAFGKFSLINSTFKSGGVENFIIENNTVSCAMFRKICWQQAGGYNKNMIHGMEDWDFWVNITKRAWLVFIIPEPLFLYRQHQISMSTNTQANKPEMYRQLVKNNIDVYKDYVDLLAYGKEKTIQKLKTDIELLHKEVMYWKKQNENSRNSNSFKIGNKIVRFLDFLGFKR